VHYFNFSVNNALNSSASSAAGPSCAIMWDGRDFLDAFNAEPEPCERSNCRLSAWSWGSWSCSPWGADFDVYGGYSFISGDFCGCRGSTHGCVGRGFHAVGFDEHAAARAGDGLGARDVGDVDYRVVVAAEYVDDAPFLVPFTAAQNLPPPLCPRLPRGCLTSGCFVTTVMPTRVG
jgi:hypothetical protein